MENILYITLISLLSYALHNVYMKSRHKFKLEDYPASPAVSNLHHAAYQHRTSPHHSQLSSKPSFIIPSLHDQAPFSSPLLSPPEFFQLFQASILSSASTTSVHVWEEDVSNPHPNLLMQGHCYSQHPRLLLGSEREIFNSFMSNKAL